MLDNYHAVTVSSVISKVFELCASDKFYAFFASHHLQFGFKKNMGCQNAIFTLQQNYFVQRGSTVYMSALNASKAFDRVNHSKLFDKLVARNMPNCILHVLINWYGKLQSVVRWNGVFSSSFTVTCGVRCHQGGVLSPFLFNIYVDQLIDDICSKNVGCYVSKGFFGCIMYADDLILLSPSVIGLQDMLKS